MGTARGEEGVAVLVPMAKVELVGPKGRLHDVVSILHDLGTLHISDLSDRIDTGEIALEHVEVNEAQHAERETMEGQLLRVRAVLRALAPSAAAGDRTARNQEYERLSELDNEGLVDEIERLVDPVEEEAHALAQQRASVEAEMALLERYEPILRKIQPLAQRTVTTGSFDFIALLIERRYKGALEQIKLELHSITGGQTEIVSTDVDEDTTAAIVVFAKKHSEAVHHFLAMENVNQIRLPSAFQDMPFDDAYAELTARRASLPDELKAADARLVRLAAAIGESLLAAQSALLERMEELGALPKFGRTQYTFLITGWVPAGRVRELSERMRSEIGPSVVVTQLEVTDQDVSEAPVQLSNSRFSAPYQSLLSLLGGGLPRYGTVDPSLMIAVFYPLFFGLIVGDIGYGLVMLAIVLWLRRKYRDNPGMQTATAILGPAATAAIIGGVVFAEVFGIDLVEKDLVGSVEIFRGVTFPFARAHGAENQMTYMYVAVGIGVLQVALGLVLGIINGVRTHAHHHTWVKSGLLAFVVGGVMLLLFGFVASIQNVALGALGALALLVGIIVAIRFGKMMGAIEALEAVGNIASYIRIMAVGLAGAIFASSANKLVAPDGEFSITGTLLAIVLHALNFAIAAFSPNIHALRLNFLEFFSKFYEPGKEEYRPFHKTGGEERK